MRIPTSASESGEARAFAERRPEVGPRGRGLGWRAGRALLAVALFGLSQLLSGARLEAQEGIRFAEPPRIGPPAGIVLAAGGGALPPEIWARFVEEAGGADARIVVLPTAATDEEWAEDDRVLPGLRSAGAGEVVVLHTRSAAVADSESFSRPLREATGVWISGGRPHRLVDAYLHTRVHTELLALLARGGIVGGSSAGASSLASFLVRGDPETNERILSEDYVEGFGLLRGAAVDQHLLTRGRAEDLWTVLDLHSDLLGIGLDEGTALLIRGDRAEALGASEVRIYDATGGEARTEVLRPGDRFDLGSRVLLSAGEPSPQPGTAPSTSTLPPTAAPLPAMR